MSEATSEHAHPEAVVLVRLLHATVEVVSGADALWDDPTFASAVGLARDALGFLSEQTDERAVEAVGRLSTLADSVVLSPAARVAGGPGPVGQAAGATRR